MTAVAAVEPGLRVLVVDDSAVVRQLMSGCLTSAGMQVQVAADPLFALQRLRTFSPDVIVLDLEMPRMDGLTFLRVLRKDSTTPVVVCSGVAGPRSVLALRALEEGAVDVVARPRVGVKSFFVESVTLLTDAIRAAAQSRRPKRARRATPAWIRPAPVVTTGPRVIAIGASTGGVEALRELIEGLPAGCPPVVVVQHMPEGFTAAFAARLGDHARVQVKEAEPGDPLIPGRVLIARGGRHLAVRARRGELYADVFAGDLVSRHRPSVDVLFHSVAEHVGRDASAAILTGMGDDGRAGMIALSKAGARTLAQDEASCVVFGMPKAAIDAGAIDTVLPLHKMAAALVHRERRTAR